MTVFVGKLPIEEQLTDERVRQILGVFGHIMQWKRSSDPSSGKLKGFGFCTFDSPDAVLKALRVLNDLQMQGWEKPILVKTDKKTTEQLEQFKARQGPAINPEADAKLKKSVEEICLGTVPAAAPFNPHAVAGAGPPMMEGVPGQPQQFQTEIEKFREAQAARDQELEKRRRARLQDRVDSAKRRERETATKAMEQKVEQELNKLKEATQTGPAAPSPKAADGSRGRRDRSRSRDRDRRGDRDRRDRRDDRDRDRRSDRDRERREKDRRGGRDSPKEYRFDGGEEGEVPEYDPMAAAQTGVAAAPPPPVVAAAAKAQAAAPRAPVSLAPVKVSLGFGGMKKKETKSKPAAKLGMFAVEEEEEESKKKKMTLVKLDYTEEEQLAVKPLAERVAAAVGRINNEHTRPEDAPIPTDKAALFAFPVDWAAVDSKNVVDKIKPFVAAKMLEYLGEEEETLIDFVTSKLHEHATPVEIEKELEMVLEGDAEVMVMELWTLLLTESRK